MIFAKDDAVIDRSTQPDTTCVCVCVGSKRISRNMGVHLLNFIPSAIYHCYPLFTVRFAFDLPLFGLRRPQCMVRSLTVWVSSLLCLYQRLRCYGWRFYCSIDDSNLAAQPSSTQTF